MNVATGINTVIKSIELVIPVVKKLIEACTFLEKKIRDDIDELYDKNEDLQRKVRSLKSEFQQMNY